MRRLSLVILLLLLLLLLLHLREEKTPRQPVESVQRVLQLNDDDARAGVRAPVCTRTTSRASNGLR